MGILFSFVIAAASSAAAAAAGEAECNTYAPLASGHATYDLEDGGCFFCGDKPHAFEVDGENAVPLTGRDLESHCESVCSADPKCRAYSVARPAVLDAHRYRWGKVANCCLDRMEPPPELTMDVSDFRGHAGELNECQLDAMCWTRHERNAGKCSEEELFMGAAVPSDQCTMMWGDRTYTPDEIEKKIGFVQNGCRYKDEQFYDMLVAAYGECRAEVDAELGNFEDFEDGH